MNTTTDRFSRIAERTSHFLRIGMPPDRAAAQAEAWVAEEEATKRRDEMDAHMSAEQARIEAEGKAERDAVEQAGERAYAASLLAQSEAGRIHAEGLANGLYEDADCTQPIENDATLPSIFYQRSGDALTRYWYTQPHSYDVHEFRENFGEGIWYGLGSAAIDDDMTAEEFMDSQG
ncbi:hypothetical protein [Methylobacterium sp. 37f]|uniref:hypothetical protein n=1 Tax=Methylobacterium sp. 37f TaxID=2817058 RepID=UPI001FFD8BB6|nr:hypothetical protein [Methylobacterium sp. 37f]MCK2054975.1 hypothetical protein [Methylobacterium sp. 37f]